MLHRKIEKDIENHLQSGNNKILVVEGARQIGKSYIIREVGKRLFPNYIEVNMEVDKLGSRTFAEAKTIDDFYLALSTVAGDKMKEKAAQWCLSMRFKPTTTCSRYSNFCARTTDSPT